MNKDEALVIARSMVSGMNMKKVISTKGNMAKMLQFGIEMTKSAEVLNIDTDKLEKLVSDEELSKISSEVWPNYISVAQDDPESIVLV